MNSNKLLLFQSCLSTVFEMLFDRGYTFEADKYPRDKIIQKKINSEFIDIIFESLTKDKILLHIAQESKVGISTIKSLVDHLQELQINHVIILLSDSITAFANKVIQDLQSSDLYDPKLIFEVFYEKELYFNITKHTLVPIHRLLTIAEKKKIFKNYHLSSFQLPKLAKSDPISRYFNFSKGDIIEISRNSKILGTSKSYRIVI